MRHLVVWGLTTVAILGFTLATQAKSLPAVKNTAVSVSTPNEDEWAVRSNFDINGRYNINAERVCHNNVVYLLLVGGWSGAPISVTPELSVSGKPNTCQSRPRN